AAATGHMDHMALMATDALAKPLPMAPRIAMVPRPSFNPVPVYIGAPAGYAGLVAQARPPHSPIGTAAPPETVSAYAATEAPPSIKGESGVPLAPAPDALPMKGQGARDKSAATPRVARHAEAHRHGGARAKIAASREARHGSRKAAKTAHSKIAVKNKTAVKIAANAKSERDKKHQAKQHQPAKALMHADTAKSKKLEKHARR
ncbi:MAG TPA: hypothetical protein VL996_15545, partial [Methylocella sp.]|nr:hypothetical protein [Methylocella sp.]